MVDQLFLFFPFSSSFPVVNVVLMSLHMCVWAHVDNGGGGVPDP